MAYTSVEETHYTICLHLEKHQSPQDEQRIASAISYDQSPNKVPHLLHFTAIVKKSSGQNPHLKRDLFNAIPKFFSKQRNDFVQKSYKGKKIRIESVRTMIALKCRTMSEEV